MSFLQINFPRKWIDEEGVKGGGGGGGEGGRQGGEGGDGSAQSASKVLRFATRYPIIPESRAPRNALNYPTPRRIKTPRRRKYSTDTWRC